MMKRKYREDEAWPYGNESSSNGGVFLFDVFLSFSGEDTRQGFTSHLYQALKQSQVETFIDSKDLPKGERISQLFQYMESSQIFVPILSKKYAKSKRCLLEAAKMVKIYERDQQKRVIIPVFYKVDPSEVKDDGGLYMSAIVQLQNEGGLQGVNVQECKDALKRIGGISGFTFKEDTKETEADIVTDICVRAQGLVCRSVPIGDQPIGIDSQIEELITMLEAQADGVCIIGICGMGGIGKTTIAKAITDKLFSEFDGFSFIEDVGTVAEQKGLPSIQRKLICGVLNFKQESISIDTVDEGRKIIKRELTSKRVLIVLDNIVKLDQLQALLGDKPKDLFEKGSKIIVTTRDKAVLRRYGMKEHQIYYPEELKGPLSLKLFNRHAFMHEPPSFELLDLAKEVAGIAGGLPLVLVTVGSVFAGLLTPEEWEGELEKIRKNRGTSILEKMKWSYDGLDNDQKCVFLDIACFLVGAKRKRAFYLWDDRSPGNAIRVLQERNLISVDVEDRFRMHDVIQEMGRWLVSSEGNLGPYMNSRLCSRNEELITSMNSQGKAKVEGIVLNMEEKCNESSLTTKVFVDMPSLRLLHLNFVNFSEAKIEHFPKALKWLQWRGCFLESVTFDNTSFENLVVLDLSRSSIHELKLNNKLDRLKVLDLSNCYIEATPDFAWTPKLEKLFLDDCGKLREVHESICCLENLTTLSMRNCESVEELPEMHRCSIADLSKLEELNLQGCQQLQSLPKLPSSLKTLILQGCKRLKAVHGFQNLESMELLDMDGCENINFTLMSSLFKGKTFSHLEELSASQSKTLSEDETLCFVVPLGSPSSPLLLQQLQCYGNGSKSGNLSNIYIKVCVKDMEDNLVIYETILSGYRDFDNDIDGRCGWCYTVSFSEYDDINIFPNLYRPCSICVSTADNFPLIRVDILLRSACRWTRNCSKLIPDGDHVTNSRRISVDQNQPLPSMLSAEYFTFEIDVLFIYVEEDIDISFINNLYKALRQHDICIFKVQDAESKGEKYLLNCIERSAICIPIFSMRFSQSKWHLKSVAKMVEFRKFIIPVYFQVGPLEIRDQKEEFGTYFSHHENEDLLEDWRKALEVVRRFHHQFIYKTSRYMKELITVICNQILSMLNSVRMTPTCFRVKDVIRMLEKDGDDVCMVGICGQSGIGKTTIAKAIYEKISQDFDGSAFFSYISIEEMNISIKEMKSQFERQRALIVFDDVDGLDKFESHKIFGKGSKIIVIAKDKGDLVRYGVKEDNIYFAHELNNMQSLRLLGYYAFKGKQPTADIVELARKVTEFAGGLPLGLAVLGSLLSNMGTKEEWESMLEKLSCAPGNGLDKVISVSMDALDPNQLQVFFDIACLKECACYPGNIIKFLEERCLISLDAEGMPRMHDRIRNWGRKWGVQNGYCKCEMPAMNILAGLDLHQQTIFLDVACCLIGHEQEYATYMWEDCGYSPTDAIEVLQHRSLISIDEKGRFKMADKIRDVGRSMVEKHELTPCFYSRIWNINDLREALDDWKAGWSNGHLEGVNASFSGDLQMHIQIEAMGNIRVLHLTNCIVHHNSLQPLKNLRWLRMEMCEVVSWKVTSDGGILEKLLVLQLHKSDIIRRAKEDGASAGNKHKEIFKKLKVLEIIHCRDVELISQDFSLMPSLVKLVIPMIEYSSHFDQIFKSICGLRKLKYLRIMGGKMKKLSSSISNLSSLETLDLGVCTSLLELPECLGDLAALRELIISDCVSLIHLPQLPCSLQTIIFRQGNLLLELPEALGDLAALRERILSECLSLKHLPQLPCSLQTLYLGGCISLLDLPEGLGDLAALGELILSGCVSLVHLPQLPCSLQTLNLGECTSLSELPESLGDLEALRELILSNCASLVRLLQLPCSLQTLDLRGCKLLLDLPEGLRNLAALRKLFLLGCVSLKHLPQLPCSLQTLDLEACNSLLNLPEGLGDLEALRELILSDCNQLKEIPSSVVQLNHLRTLIINDCTSLHCLPQLPSSLIKIYAFGCTNLRQVADISSLQDLETLDLQGCDELEDVPGLQNLKSLTTLKLPFHLKLRENHMSGRENHMSWRENHGESYESEGEALE